MQRIFVSVLLLIGGLAVFLLGAPYYKLFPTNSNPYYLGPLATLLLLLALALKRWAANADIWRAAYALFMAAAAMLSTALGPFNFLIRSTDPFINIAQDKLAQALAVVLPILVLTLLSRQSLGDIFLQRGRPRQWLGFGLISFAVFAGLALVIIMIAGVAPMSLVPAVPWILLFVAANALMEELWFRGIFLRPYEPLIGRWGTIIVTSIVFGALHINATYVSPALQFGFGALTAVLGAVAALNMIRSDSIWGAVLFHAGYDLLIILPVVQSV